MATPLPGRVPAIAEWRSGGWRELGEGRPGPDQVQAKGWLKLAWMNHTTWDMHAFHFQDSLRRLMPVGDDFAHPDDATGEQGGQGPKRVNPRCHSHAGPCKAVCEGHGHCHLLLQGLLSQERQ